ncbi:probable cytokinin riboside 5'-monophosphate phosphoribohydrolase LOGL3 [Primulina eburnea]|uniref:probable cytokinin riboside 5'-monophosphate phosphoribohydrolase LOGL3 n=1 Tax=Primulina eburnea TaxID=1245227 RepID=UPI003C6C9198
MIHLVYGGGEVGLMGKVAITAHTDAFIALSGGFGTLEEIFHIVFWAQLNIHHEPIGLLNVNKYNDKVLSFLDDVVEHEFISLASRKMLVSATSEDELIDLL